MKKIHIVRRSLIAMFWGWVACSIANISMLVSALMLRHSGGGRWDQMALQLMQITFFSTGIVFVAWLLLFLPADLLVKQSSILRNPGLAAVCGGLAGGLSILIPFGFDGSGSVDTSPIDRLMRLSPLIWIIATAAAVCGLTASLYLTLHYPRTQPSKPENFKPNTP